MDGQLNNLNLDPLPANKNVYTDKYLVPIVCKVPPYSYTFQQKYEMIKVYEHLHLIYLHLQQESFQINLKFEKIKLMSDTINLVLMKGESEEVQYRIYWENGFWMLWQGKFSCIKIKNDMVYIKEHTLSSALEKLHQQAIYVKFDLMKLNYDLCYVQVQMDNAIENVLMMDACSSY